MIPELQPDKVAEIAQVLQSLIGQPPPATVADVHELLTDTVLPSFHTLCEQTLALHDELAAAREENDGGGELLGAFGRGAGLLQDASNVLVQLREYLSEDTPPELLAQAEMVLVRNHAFFDGASLDEAERRVHARFAEHADDNDDKGKGKGNGNLSDWEPDRPYRSKDKFESEDDAWADIEATDPEFYDRNRFAPNHSRKRYRWDEQRPFSDEA